MNGRGGDFPSPSTMRYTHHKLSSEFVINIRAGVISYHGSRNESHTTASTHKICGIKVSSQQHEESRLSCAYVGTKRLSSAPLGILLLIAGHKNAVNVSGG